MRDLHNQIKCSRAISPAAAVTNNAAFVSQIADKQNYESLDLVVQFGAVGNGTFTCLVEEGNDSALADASTVAAADLLGTTTLAPAANQTFKIGYRGSKRYCRVTITPVGNSGNIFLAAAWVQSHARTLPQSTQLV